MKTSHFLFLLLLSNLLFLLVSCAWRDQYKIGDLFHERLKNLIEQEGVNDFAYVICKKGIVVDNFYANKSRTIDALFSNDIWDHFNLPILALNRLKNINGKNSLSSDRARQLEQLLFVRRNAFQPEDMGLYVSNQQIQNHINRLGQKENISEGGKSVNQLPLSDFFQKMVLVENKFKSDLPRYNFRNKNIQNLFPTWYVENMEKFLGYHVMQLGRQAVLWHSFHDQEYEILVVKNIEQEFFAVIAVPYKALPSTDRMGRKDLLQSPLGLCITEYLMDSADQTTYSASRQLIGNRKDLLRAELLGYRNPRAADSVLDILEARTGSDLYRYRMRAPVLTEIDNISDYSSAGKQFILQTDTWLKIFANGQSLKKRNVADQAYEYDNIQLFINKDGDENRRNAGNTGLFQFNVGTVKEEGKNSGGEIAYAFHIEGNSHYTLEIKLPWTKIGFENPRVGKSLSMNVLANDSDLQEDKRKSILSWSMDGYYHFMDVSKYGKVLLLNRKSKDNYAEITSVYTKKSPNIDGLEDPEWRTCEHTDVSKNYSGSATKDDHAIKFKSLWDDENIYLFFEVEDNIINALGYVTKDKCWIRDENNGNIIWKLAGNSTLEKDISVGDDQILFLKAGKYTVHYISDNSHSYNGWYGRPPGNDLYGISIYKVYRD